MQCELYSTSASSANRCRRGTSRRSAATSCASHCEYGCDIQSATSNGIDSASRGGAQSTCVSSDAATFACQTEQSSGCSMPENGSARCCSGISSMRRTRRQEVQLSGNGSNCGYHPTYNRRQRTPTNLLKCRNCYPFVPCSKKDVPNNFGTSQDHNVSIRN